MFKWIWGEKRKEYPLKFESKPKEIDYVGKQVRIHLELNINIPDYCNVIDVLKESKMNFELPFQSNLKGVSISNIEVLN